MISTATPKETPSTDIRVITETNVLLGRKYRIASSTSNGNGDIVGRTLNARVLGVNPCRKQKPADNCRT